MAKIGYCAYCGGEYTYLRKRENGTCSDACRQNLRRAKQEEGSGLVARTPTPFAQVFMTKVLLLGGGVAHLAKLTTQSRWKAFTRSEEGARAKRALMRERDRLDALIGLFPEDAPDVEREVYEPTAEDMAKAMRWWDQRLSNVTDRPSSQ